jgi:hypothetical protein
MIRTSLAAVTAAAMLTLVSAAHAVTYKCKDADGNWTEEACPPALKNSSPASSTTPPASAAEAPVDAHQSPAEGMTETNVYNLDPPWNRPETTHTRKDNGVLVDEFWYRVDDVIATRLIFRNGILSEVSHTPPETIPEPPFDAHQGPAIGMKLSNVYNLDPPWNRPDSTLSRVDDDEGVRIDEYSYKSNGTRLIFKNSVLSSIEN